MRYSNTPISKTSEGKKYYISTFYPPINPKESDIYVITTQGDRLDLLANQYYNDPSLWWIISGANNIDRGSIFIPFGTQLRIPMDITGFLQEFNSINKNR